MVSIPTGDAGKELDALAEKALKEYNEYLDKRPNRTNGAQDMLDTNRAFTRYKHARQAVIDKLTDFNYKDENAPAVLHLDEDEKVKRCADRWGVTVPEAHRQLGASADGRIEDVKRELNAKGGHYFYDSDSSKDIALTFGRSA